MNFIKKSIPNSVVFLIVSYTFLLVWWIFLWKSGITNTQENYLFGLCEGVFAIICGITGLTKGKVWGSFSSYIGKAVMFISLGFIAWGLGTLVIAYYNLILNLAYPYPSLADLAYILSWPLWFAGIFNLSRSMGIGLRIKSVTGKLMTLLLMAFALALSYYLLIVVARGGVFEINTENYLRLFFDFAYPVGDVIIITASLVTFGLSMNYLGGALRTPILIIIFGFALNYTADIVFTYTNTIGTFYVSNWVDLLYVTAFLCLGIGVNFFDQKIITQQ